MQPLVKNIYSIDNGMSLRTFNNSFANTVPLMSDSDSKRKQTYQDAVDFISLTYQKTLYNNPSDISLYLIGQPEPRKGQDYPFYPIQNTQNVYQVPNYQFKDPNNIQYLFVIRLILDDVYNSVKIVHPDPQIAGETMYSLERIEGTPEHLYISEALKASFLRNPYPFSIYKSQYIYKNKLKNVACQNYFKDPTTPYNSSTNNNEVYVFCCGYLPSDDLS